MKWRLEVLGGSHIGAGPTCKKQSLTKHTKVLFNIWRSQDFSFEWNVYKNSISGDRECRTGPSRVDKWASSCLPLVNKERGKRKQTGNYTGISSLLAREFIQPPPPREMLSKWRPASFHTKVTTKRLSSVRMQVYCTTRLLKWHYITACLNCSFKPRRHRLPPCSYNEAAGGFLRQTDLILCSVAGQQLVGQWLIT